MKRLLIISAFLLAGAWPQFGRPTPRAPASLPGLVNDRSASSSRSNSVSSNVERCGVDDLCSHYVDPTGARNVGIVSFTYSASPAGTPEVTDNKSDSYTCPQSVEDTSAAATYVESCYTSLAADAHDVTLDYGVAKTDASMKLAQFYNTGTLDTSASNASAAATTTMTAGSVAPSSGDLLYVYICRTGQALGTSSGGTFTPATQAGVTWTLLTTDTVDGCMDMYGVWSGTGSIDPQVTSSASASYAGIVLAFHPSPGTGIAPSGMYISKLQTFNLPGTTVGPISAQFANAGNLVVMAAECATPMVVTSIMDGSRRWDQARPLIEYNNSAAWPTSSLWYVPNASPSLPGALTMNTTGRKGCGPVALYDIAGAAASPFANAAAWIQNSPTAGSTVPLIPSSAGFQPGITGGLVIVSTGIAFDTLNGVAAPSGTIFDSETGGCPKISGGCSTDENNFMGHQYISSNTAYPWIGHLSSPSIAPGEMSPSASSWLSATGSRAAYKGFVTNVCAFGSTPASSISCTVQPAHSGDILLVVGYASPASSVALSLAGGGYTWKPIDALDVHQNQQDDWYTTSTSTAPFTLTLKLSKPLPSQGIWLFDLEGVSALDAHAMSAESPGSGGVFFSPSVTATGPGDIACAFDHASKSAAMGSPWAWTDDDTNGHNSGNAFGCRILRSAGAISASFTESSGTGSIENAGIVAFK
jgi:hypothetical protein